MVYGVVVIGALLAAEGGRHDTYPETLGATLLATLLVWLAHSYSTLLGRRLQSGSHIHARALRSALARDTVILKGGIPPFVVIALCGIAGLSQTAGVTAGVWTVVVVLMALEVIAGLRSGAAAREFTLDLLVGLTLGVGILVLKILLK